MDATVETGRNPVSKSTRFSLNVENEQAGAGRDDRTCPTRPNSQAQRGTGKKISLADHEQGMIANLLYVVIIIHICMYVSMYVCMVITYSKGQPDKVSNPARVQVKRENDVFLVVPVRV